MGWRCDEGFDAIIIGAGQAARRSSAGPMFPIDSLACARKESGQRRTAQQGVGTAQQGAVDQFAVWLGFDGFLKMTRRQQINTPVNARTAGISPRSAHTASVNQLNRPKCSCVSHATTRPAGSRNTETTELILEHQIDA